VLKVLLEAGIRPSAVSGTSFGALIAAQYALHGDVRRLEAWVEGLRAGEVWRHGLDFGLHRACLVEGGRLEAWMERTLFHGATFEDIRLPLYITCTDALTGEGVVLREGSLAKAVRASCALPLITTAVDIGGRKLIDGGFTSPVPVAPLGAVSDAVLGIHTGIEVEKARLIRLFRRLHASRWGTFWHRRMLGTPFDTVWGTLCRGLAHAAASYNQRPDFPPDVLLLKVRPPVAWWDLHKGPRAVAAGERAMRPFLPELRARLLVGTR